MSAAVVPRIAVSGSIVSRFIVSRFIGLVLAASVAVFATPASAQRWDLDEGFVRGEGDWVAAANLQVRGATLSVRCIGDRLDAYLDPPFEVRGQQALQVRITLPDREPVVQSWPVEASMGVAFAPGAGRLARQLMAAGPMTLEVADAVGTFRPVRLSSSAAADTIGRVLQTCDVPATDLDSQLPSVDTRLIDAIDEAHISVAWGLRQLLLDGAERQDLATRPLALYRRLNYFHAVTLPELCQNRQSVFWNLRACVGLRDRLARDGMPVLDANPIDAFLEFHRMGGRTGAAQERPADCSEPDSGPIPPGEFDMSRIFVDSAGRTLSSGVVRASFVISPEGEVTDVRVILARPAFRFDRALEREVRTMRFVPARENCRPVPSTFLFGITFYIDRAIFPLGPPRF